MIFVDRPSFPVPEILLSQHAEVARNKVASLLRSSSGGHLDQLRVSFDSSIWLRAQPALLELFQGKCAYCESRITDFAFADVEHFRPRQDATDLQGNRQQLYYAWLAYEWDNLLIVCPTCNQQGKRQYFPVNGPRAPMLAGIEECREIEGSTLLDPCFDQPSEHLSFESQGLCSPLSDRGRLTTELIQLNRPPLVLQPHR